MDEEVSKKFWHVDGSMDYQSNEIRELKGRVNSLELKLGTRDVVTDTDIVEWISQNPKERLRVLLANWDTGFCKGMKFRDLVRKISKWIEEVK